ncbi:uncharacterized protein LOC134271023 isoform X2 [Saccostrea cucullata]|uniref:uncharacterized protein LOC134271023 isoform X2 n=1 Tax=Saccostrea cuccullata TaxID=36930 RepID=UPI002ED31BAD
MCSKSAAFYFCLTCLLAPSLLLQATGFYSPYWIKHNSTSDCFRGIILSVNCNETIEGIIGFAGCMLVASNYRDHEKGWSFYISLAASCYVMLLSLVFCCAIYRYAKKEKGTYNKDGNVNRSYVGNEVAQYDESRGSQDNSAMASSGDGGLVFSHVHEEYNVEISNRGSIMISTLQIARMFHMK